MVRPQLVVVSLSEEDPYSHPDSEVMAHLTDMAKVLTAAEHGDITLLCDGRSIRVVTQR